MPFIGVQVSGELKARFDALASTEGGKSVLLRRILEAVVSPGSTAPSTPPGGGRSDKITVRFRRAEGAAITDAAVARGMTRTGWIAALVRARLSLALPLTSGEEEALRTIARELSRIGARVDQLARVADGQALAGTPVEIDTRALAETAAAVRGAASELRQALGRSSSYWQTPV